MVNKELSCGGGGPEWALLRPGFLRGSFQGAWLEPGDPPGSGEGLDSSYRSRSGSSHPQEELLCFLSPRVTGLLCKCFRNAFVLTVFI